MTTDEIGRNSPTNKNSLFFHYQFKFEDGTQNEFMIRLDPKKLHYLPEQPSFGGDWIRLEHHQCKNCPLDSDTSPNCPVALSIEDMVSAFRARFSYETSKVTVSTNERVYYKKTTMQDGLSSIMGILMVSSGCPVMAKLRPMVRFHLPFASIMETVFRTTSTYLLGQFFLLKRNRTPDFTFQGLVEIYKNIRMVNVAMAKRIASLAEKDASVNALIILDVFASDVPFSIEEEIKGLEDLFMTYFD